MEHMKAYLRDRGRSLLLQLSSFAILLLVLLLYRLPVEAVAYAAAHLCRH